MSEDFNDSDEFAGEVPEENLGSQVMEFDIVFQQGILRLALEDDHFCSQLVKYLGMDKDLKNVDFLETDEFNVIFEMIVEGFKKYQRRPSEGQLRQKIIEFKPDPKSKTKATVKGLTAAANLIYKTDISDENYYRQNIGAYVQQVKFIRAYKNMKTTFIKNDRNKAIQVFQGMLDGLTAVSFEKDSIFKLSDFSHMYETNKNSGVSRIPTGITKLDKDTLGGLPRQGLTVVLAGTNVGKSMFCVSLAAQALKAKDEAGLNRGFKVFHINLEGNAQSIIFRYYSNLSQIPYERIVKGELTEEEMARLKRIEEEYNSRFMIKNLAGSFNNTIESLEAYCKEVHKKFKFDLLLVDYGQLLETSRDVGEYRHIMATVFRGLDTMSKAFNCAVVSPAQGTRNAQEKQNVPNFGGKFAAPKDAKAPVMRSSDISEAFEIARVADMILSLNATDEEKVQGRLRVFMEKQRDGEKNKTYGVHTRFDLSDLITGKFYDANSTVTRENETPEQVDSLESGLNKLQKEVVIADGPEGEMDLLIEAYRKESKIESGIKADYNIEKMKSQDKRNMDIIAQLTQDMEKYADKKKKIAADAQEVMKRLDPTATEEMLKLMEKSLKDLDRENATDEVMQAQIKVVDRYRLGLKGKL